MQHPREEVHPLVAEMEESERIEEAQAQEEAFDMSLIIGKVWEDVGYNSMK